MEDKNLSEEVTYGVPEWNWDELGGYTALHRFAVTQRNLFKDMPLMPHTKQVLRKLSECKVHIRIITHRLFIKYFHKEAAIQTIEWLDYHGIPYWDLCFLKEKDDVGADFYIEDAPHNIERLRKNGKDVIIFTNSTNHSCPK